MEKTKAVTINAVPVRIVKAAQQKAKKEGMRVNEAWVRLLDAGLSALAQELGK